MKKLGLFAMAFALVMTMTQCKKENTTTVTDEGVKVPITLNVSSNNGSRVDVETETGVVTFETGDVIHVVSNGVYVGTLAYNGTQFAGEINEPTAGRKLQFYFLGNKTPEFNADNTECSVVISDQTEYLPVISYAPSRENYQIGKIDYNATLLNKCALVKFDVTTVSNATTCILGLRNKVTVNFSNNGFTYSQEDEGIITLAAGSGERWAILLPNGPITSPLEAKSSDGLYCGNCSTIQDIDANDYLTDGIAVTVNSPVGGTNGFFTVNANGDQVYFSQGNLQYIGSAATPYWKFADHQWDCFVKNTGQNSNSQYVDRDLFGWGTSGYNHGAVAYQPWATSTTHSQYYAYGNSQFNLYDGNGQADWGYNAIVNGGNQENSGWRTLTSAEWAYIIYTRSTPSDIRYAKGKVNGVKGLILLPDNWSASIYTLNSANGNYYSSNTISADDWTNILEPNGAVFLPAATIRRGININSGWLELGDYWSSSYSVNVTNWAYYVYFNSTGLNPEDEYYRSDGRSVRLVRDVE